jgi:hypothetical protein
MLRISGRLHPVGWSVNAASDDAVKSVDDDDDDKHDQDDDEEEEIKGKGEGTVGDLCGCWTGEVGDR